MNDDFTKFEPHKKNPIKVNYYGGRSAGPILKFKSKIIRPAQIYRKNNYGYGLVFFFEILKLNLFEYREKKIFTLLPNQFQNSKGIHHISNLGNDFIIDLNLKH